MGSGQGGATGTDLKAQYACNQTKITMVLKKMSDQSHLEQVVIRVVEREAEDQPSDSLNPFRVLPMPMNNHAIVKNP